MKAIDFHYCQQFFGENPFELKGEVLSHRDFYLHDIAFSDFNDNPSFIFDFSLLTADKKKADHFEASVKLKPRQLFQRIEEMKQKNEPTMVFKLFDQYPENKQKQKLMYPKMYAAKIKGYEAEKMREHLEPARSVVDLHIEKLSG